MTYEQIENVVARKTDSLDRALMARRLTQAEYDFKIRALGRWAERAFAWAKE